MKKSFCAALLGTALLCASSCLFFVGCGKKEGELTPITLNEVAHSIFYAPQYAAIELGYFEEEGIDLTLETGFGADKTMTALISGDADIGFMGSEASIYAYLEGAKDYAVNFAQLTQRAGNFLVAREAMPDFSWEDLKETTVLGGRKRLAVAAGNEGLINETYDSMQKDLFAQIHGLEMQIKELNETALETPDVKDKLKDALEVVDKIIAGGSLDRRDIELLIEKIVVDEDGMPEITLKYGLSNLISYSPADEMNRRENTMIAIVMKLTAEDEQGYTLPNICRNISLTWDSKKQSKVYFHILS